MSNKYQDSLGNKYQKPEPVEPKGMHISVKGIKLIHSFESCSLLAYDDLRGIKSAGKKQPLIGTATIGWGATRYEDGRRVKMGDVITQEEADALFLTDIRKRETIVEDYVKRELKQHEFDALVSFVYNAGTSYKAGNAWVPYNLWKNVNRNLQGEAMQKYWRKLAIKSKGRVLDGLRRRRWAEVHLYLHNELKYLS